MMIRGQQITRLWRTPTMEDADAATIDEYVYIYLSIYISFISIAFIASATATVLPMFVCLFVSLLNSPLSMRTTPTCPLSTSLPQRPSSLQVLPEHHISYNLNAIQQWQWQSWHVENNTPSSTWTCRWTKRGDVHEAMQRGEGRVADAERERMFDWCREGKDVVLVMVLIEDVLALLLMMLTKKSSVRTCWRSKCCFWRRRRDGTPVPVVSSNIVEHRP